MADDATYRRAIHDADVAAQYATKESERATLSIANESNPIRVAWIGAACDRALEAAAHAELARKRLAALVHSRIRLPASDNEILEQCVAKTGCAMECGKFITLLVP